MNDFINPKFFLWEEADEREVVMKQLNNNAAAGWQRLFLHTEGWKGL